MISRMAMKDIEALRADGIDVPPREVVRLNALGLRVERSARAADFHVLPRVAFLGSIAFHEPTIGDETWLAEAQRVFADDVETVALLQSVCLSAKGELPDPTDREQVMAAIKSFQVRAARFTLSQILAAVSYAWTGADHVTGEYAPPRDGDGEDAEEPSEADVPPLVAGVIRDGLALRIGTVDEMMKMRTSQVIAAAEAALAIEQGPEAFKNARSAAFADYMRTLEAVRDSVRRGDGSKLDAMRTPGDDGNQKVEKNDGNQHEDAHHDMSPAASAVSVAANSGRPPVCDSAGCHGEDYTNG